MKFRPLKASEIDVRVGSIKENGLSLLLYKDARADMIILDEIVGAMNWQRKHTRDNANCIVSIYDSEKNQWVEKEDTGAESFTEKEKGLASDSFKRACFNWGIGRELYTAPFIWISNTLCNIKNKNGKFSCYDSFEVKEITYKNDCIQDLVITAKGKEVFSTKGKIKVEKPNVPKPSIPINYMTEEQKAELLSLGADLEKVARHYDTTVHHIRKEQAEEAIQIKQKQILEGMQNG